MKQTVISIHIWRHESASRALPPPQQNPDFIPDNHTAGLKACRNQWPSYFFLPEGTTTHVTYRYTNICSKALKQAFQNNTGKMNDQAHDRVKECLFSLSQRLLFIYKFLPWCLCPNISPEKRGLGNLLTPLPRASLH